MAYGLYLNGFIIKWFDEHENNFSGCIHTLNHLLRLKMCKVRTKTQRMKELSLFNIIIMGY